MMYIAALSRATSLTFGRPASQFRELITLFAAISVVLWFIVLTTIIARWYFCHIWYRKQYSAEQINTTPK